MRQLKQALQWLTTSFLCGIMLAVGAVVVGCAWMFIAIGKLCNMVFLGMVWLAGHRNDSDDNDPVGK